jgi:acyl dehydratase
VNAPVLGPPLTSPTTYFEDFYVGQRIRHARGATVGDVENNFLSKLVMNTAQGHWNKHYTGGGKLGPGQVVFGLLTASIVLGLASADTTDNALAELGCTGFRFRGAVRQGDTLYAFTEVLGVDGALPPATPSAGIVHFKHWGVNHEHTLVFEGERTALIKRRQPPGDPT